MKKYHASQGFTLVELLTVIAIVGILTAILVPTVGRVRDNAQRAVDGSNLREIAKAMLLYASDNNERLPDPATLATGFPVETGAHRIVAALARSGVINDASFYYSKLDPQFNGVYPAAILDPASATHNELDPGFTDGRYLSWEFVGGVKLGDPASTPIAYTRGLNSSGNWDAGSGVYRDAGGYVAYLGGSVVYYSTVAGKLKSYATGEPVSDIRLAIPYTAANPSKLYATPPPATTVLGTAAGTPAIAPP